MDRVPRLRGSAWYAFRDTPVSVDRVSETAPVSVDRASEITPVSVGPRSEITPVSVDRVSEIAPVSVDALRDCAGQRGPRFAGRLEEVRPAAVAGPLDDDPQRRCPRSRDDLHLAATAPVRIGKPGEQTPISTTWLTEESAIIESELARTSQGHVRARLGLLAARLAERAGHLADARQRITKHSSSSRSSCRRSSRTAPGIRPRGRGPGRRPCRAECALVSGDEQARVRALGAELRLAKGDAAGARQAFANSTRNPGILGL